MEVFGQNPHRIVDGYTEEFEESFLDHMKRSHRFSRVAATVIYNEYIANRHHVHMNSTQWATLTEFVKYLGKEGKCKVEETPKGWFMTYIDRDSETMFKERLKNKRLKSDVVEEVKHEREIQKQIELAAQMVPSAVLENGSEELVMPKLEPGVKIAFSLGSTASIGESSSSATKVVFDDESEKSEKKRRRDSKSTEGGNVGRSALDEVMKEDEKAKERINRKDYWVCEGIIVKVMNKELADKGYYKQKGLVVKVIDNYVGEIQMLENKHVIRVDQAELQTVLPQIGGLVKIVNGAYRGSKAKLVSVDFDNYCAKVQIEKGLYDGRVLQAVAYEDICKLA
ncbi:hypothetical protein IFM89_015910 [Coptis chinensis]|uniref:DNA/RNA-binding protein Kin17 WH-like domain-containing protein n=1 Tax=Coptis chinensis TaxID=261450 RepID=A0A835HTY4_9MAGN|nr:hypothetical protein IFM89_015910 [Coptis chinensis]